MAAAILSCKWVLTDGWNLISGNPSGLQITKKLWSCSHPHWLKSFIFCTTHSSFFLQIKLCSFRGCFKIWTIKSFMSSFWISNALEYKQFSVPPGALEASWAHPCVRLWLLFPLTHLSCVNGFRPSDWLECVSIDPAHPTLESGA